MDMKISGNSISYSNGGYAAEPKATVKNANTEPQDKILISGSSNSVNDMKSALSEFGKSGTRISNQNPPQDKNAERLGICQAIMVGVSPMMAMTGVLAALIGGPTTLAIGMIAASGIAGVASYIGEGYYASKMAENMPKQA